MKKILIFISLFSILSCSVKKPLPESFTHNIPELNTTNKTEIGITLVTKESGYKYDAIRILKTLKVKSFLESFEFKEGDVFIHDLYTKKFNLYGNNNSTCRIAIPTIGENIGKALPYYNNNSGSIVFYNIKDKIEFEKTFVPVIEQKEYFKQEFIYNGRVGTALKFIYREYINELARPAFTQDLQYDLNESKIIGFRGLRIEVISATNTIIEYKVLNQFSK